MSIAGILVALGIMKNEAPELEKERKNQEKCDKNTQNKAAK